MQTSPRLLAARTASIFISRIVLAALFLGTALHAAEGTAKKTFDLPAGDALASLKAFAQQSGVEMLYSTRDIAGARTNAVRGQFTPRDALERMLHGTNLVMTEGKSKGAIAVTRAPDPNGVRAAPRTTGDRPTRRAYFEENTETQHTMKSKNPIATLLAWMALTMTPAQSAETAGQTRSVSPQPGALEDATTPDVVVLSPFTVDTSRDRGYQAENTLSGTRLNSSLADTPASVSVMTQEFLQDVGLDNLGELVGYSVNSEVDEFDTSSSSHPDQTNAKYIVRPITTRGIRASQGLDSFESITPDDAYRIGRYDDSRGPNGILFGVSEAGGLINQTSKVANTRQDSAKIKWSTGSYDRNRVEFDMNKIIRPRTLAVSVAAVHQENGGWKLYDYQDKQRLFGSVHFRPHERISVNVMAETGREFSAIAPAYTPLDNALAWLDNRDALGVSAVTFAPLNANPTAAMQALGVTTRNAAANGVNRRLTYITNDGGILFDSVGTYLSGGYNNPAVRAPDGTPGAGGNAIRINDPSVLPYHVNAKGPGSYRDLELRNHTISADWQIAKGLFANFGHNFQKVDLTTPFMPGAANPSLRGDPNTTLGVRGDPNPYAGQLYLEGNWRRGHHIKERRENRISVSYEINTRRFGLHRVATMFSRSEDRDIYMNGWLVLAGSPFGGAPDATNNRLSTRQYINPSNPDTFTGGDWRDLPSSLTVDGNTYNVVWANTAAQTTAADLGLKTGLIVAQSHFFSRRLVTTLGYRDDRATLTTFGSTIDPIAGALPDFNPANAIDGRSRGITRTQGMVFHTPWGVSLIANASSNIGLPDFSREVFPHGTIADPSEGKGRDYGIAVDLWNRKLTAKAVYFETSDAGKVALHNVVNLHSNMNIRVMEALGSVLVGPGRPISESEWSATRAELTPSVRGARSDVDSRGYEFSAIANPTPNLRLTVSYSYSDRKATNTYMSDVVPWYGFKVDDGLIVNGVTQDSSGLFILDPTAYESGGTIARWIELSQRHPEAALSTLLTSNQRTIAEEIFVTTEGMNDVKRDQEKRWGLRPHRVSLFAAYDFRGENFLKGVTIGGGYRWRGANIIGEDASGRELSGRPIREADLMLRYARAVKPALWKGRLILQVNLINAFNEKGIMPRYISRIPPYEVPGDRGIGYNRFDVIKPRMVRFTTTYEF